MALQWDICSLEGGDPSLQLPVSDCSTAKIDMDDDLADLWGNLDPQPIQSEMDTTLTSGSEPHMTSGIDDDSIPALLGDADDSWLDFAVEPPQPTVVNDCLFSSVNAPHNRSRKPHSEHSYSLHGQRNAALVSCSVKQEAEMDTEQTNGHHMDNITHHVVIPETQQTVTVKTETENDFIKQEPVELQYTDYSSSSTCTTRYTVTSAPTRPTTVLVRPSALTTSGTPTIVVAASRSLLPSTGHTLPTQVVIPRNTTVKVESLEAGDDVLRLPPTPPGSSGGCSSDSDTGSGSSSPRHHTTHGPDSIHSSPTPYPNFSPIPTTGLLILTEEEKRTLVQEGYPVPNKLPLTKQEERNLKKIRRKIKNKISAQESRRKKKEYLESLEKKVEAYSQDNHDLRRKVDNLENNNKSLLTQLHKLQALVRGRGALPSTTTASTGVMVLVLFFAVFLGTWAPSSLSFGYGSAPASPMSDRPFMIPVLPADRLSLPDAADRPPANPSMPPDQPDNLYNTPTVRSRVLLSYREEDEYTTLYVPWGSHHHTPVDTQPAATETSQDLAASIKTSQDPEDEVSTSEDPAAEGSSSEDLVAESAVSEGLEFKESLSQEIAHQLNDKKTEPLGGLEVSLASGGDDWTIRRPDVVADIDVGLLEVEPKPTQLNATA